MNEESERSSSSLGVVLRRVGFWGAVLCSAGFFAACGESSEQRDAEGNGGAGGSSGEVDPGASGGAGEVVQARGWDACPEGFEERPDVDAEFALVAGSYGVRFPEGLNENCRAAGASFLAGKAYALVVSETERSFALETERGRFVRVWDDELDVACAGRIVSGIEIEDETTVLRLSFAGGKPRDLVVGLCVGEVTPAE